MGTTADRLAKERYLNNLKLAREGAAANPFETPGERERRIKLCKRDVREFVKYYFSRYATSESADFQISLANRVARDKKCFELVRWGRGLAKSVWCDLIIPAWLWARGESVYMVIVGNNLDKAKILLSDVQAEFEANPRLLHDFGEQKMAGSWEDGDFKTRDGRFIGKALGMGQSPRGLRVGSLRPNYLACDDLEDRETVKNPKRQDEVVEWVLRDLIPTMDGPVRRYLHPGNDFAPRTIQNQLEKRNPTWNVDTVKAYDKETYKPAWWQKYSPDYYREMERDIGIIAARAEYLHEALVQGKIFTRELFQWAKPPRIDSFRVITGHWDVAYSGKNDYNAVKVWGLHGINFWQLKAFVRQCKMEEAIRFMYDFEDTLPVGTIIHWRVEAQFWNDPVRQAIDKVRAERGRWLNISIVDRSRQHKYDRLLSMHPYYQNGRVYYNAREEASNDMQAGLAQLMAIEPGYSTHDDAPDADQQAVEYLSGFVKYGTGNGYGVETGGSFRKNRM